MAKVSYIDPVESVSGKLSKKSRTVYALNNQTGVKYGYYRSERKVYNPTADQLAQQALFKRTVEKIKAAMSDPEQWAQIKASYKKDNKGYKTLHGFAFNYFYNQD